MSIRWGFPPCIIPIVEGCRSTVQVDSLRHPSPPPITLRATVSARGPMGRKLCVLQCPQRRRQSELGLWLQRYLCVRPPGMQGLWSSFGEGEPTWPKAKTLGCIRTTDEGSAYLKALNAVDPITEIVVSHDGTAPPAPSLSNYWFNLSYSGRNQ
jgi:hypothetical protein